MIEQPVRNEGTLYSDGNIHISVAEVVVPGYRRHLEGANSAWIYDGRDEYRGLRWYHWLALAVKVAGVLFAVWLTFLGFDWWSPLLIITGGVLIVVIWITLNELVFSRPFQVRLYTDDGPVEIYFTKDFWLARTITVTINKAIEQRNLVLIEE